MNGQKNVTYDETVYNVTITVTDNGKGNLIAEAVYGDGRTPQFVNTYVKPQKSGETGTADPDCKTTESGSGSRPEIIIRLRERWEWRRLL